MREPAATQSRAGFSAQDRAAAKPWPKESSAPLSLPTPASPTPASVFPPELSYPFGGFSLFLPHLGPWLPGQCSLPPWPLRHFPGRPQKAAACPRCPKCSSRPRRGFLLVPAGRGGEHGDWGGGIWEPWGLLSKENSALLVQAGAGCGSCLGRTQQLPRVVYGDGKPTGGIFVWKKKHKKK